VVNQELKQVNDLILKKTDHWEVSETPSTPTKDA
jgi:hypothetical protein